MGIKLGPLLETRPIKVEELANQKVAIDGYNILYQFLSSIRQADGNLLTDSEGRVTSHLSGLFFRISTLVDNGIRPCIVFDGKPPRFRNLLNLFILITIGECDCTRHMRIFNSKTS